VNIVLYISSFLPEIGGREFVVHYLAEAFQSLGHQVRVLGPAGWWRDRKFRFSYPVHRWPTLRGLSPEASASTQLLLDTALWGADVIHAHNTYPTGYNAARFKRIHNIPLVITPHGEDIHVVPELKRGLRLDPEIAPKIGYAVQHADLVTAISASVESSLRDAGAPSEKIRLIPNGVDIARFEKDTDVNVYEWLNLPRHAKIILTVGGYGPNRGHEVLVRALAQIIKEEPAARLVIVGRDTGVLHNLIRQAGVEGKVVLPGLVQSPISAGTGNAAWLGADRKDRLAALFRSSAVYVSAGIADGAEGMSLALLEGMAAGLPIVATRISGNRDVVLDQDNGFLIKPADDQELAGKVLQLLKNDELRMQMGARSKLLVQPYQWHEIAKQYLKVYQEAIFRAGQR
jgi:teichuronic acid biosynthesis glycosyltransferase TuaC